MASKNNWVRDHLEQFTKGHSTKVKKLVVVKRLEKLVEEGEREFRAKMRAIGRTHHRNLVRLLGYCIKDSKGLLVYEYMSNGSLADHLFKAQTSPNWNVIGPTNIHIS